MPCSTAFATSTWCRFPAWCTSGPPVLANPNVPTGEVEVVVEAAQVLNEARTTPFYINEDAAVDEALRLKYRYLDLRRLPMQGNIILRHNVVKVVR